jgi:hypothetical protein
MFAPVALRLGRRIMPQDDHPGYDFWDVTDINHPFPVDPIVFGTSTGEGGSASATVTLPPKLPRPKVVAERSIGMARSAKLWFALRCEQDAQGNIACEAVLRGQHLNFFPEHGEGDVGPLQEIRLSTAQMRAGGFEQRVAGHGPHCDTFSATWNAWPNQFTFTLGTWHFAMTPETFRAAQDKAAREAYYTPPSPKPRGLVPEIPFPTPPEPEPEPEPPGT